MSAKNIFEHASLGALVRYSDGQPRPPERFRKKLAAWKNNNGSGRLIQKTPAVQRPTYSLPASFTLHEGDFGSDGIIVMVVHKTYSIDSSLHFEVEEPAPGTVRVLTSFQGVDELRHLAPDMPSAEAWLASHGYSDARFEIVEAGPDASAYMGVAA